jgi:hypothetical protein
MAERDVQATLRFPDIKHQQSLTASCSLSLDCRVFHEGSCKLVSPPPISDSFLAGVAAIFVPIGLYFLLVEVGIDASASQVWSTGSAATILTVAAWWRAQDPSAGRAVALPLWNRLLRAAILFVVAFGMETLVGAAVLGIAGVGATVSGGSEQQFQAARDALYATVITPVVALLLIFIGFWSARLLPVRKVHWWLLGIVAVWWLLRVGVYLAGAIPYAQRHGIPLAGPFRGLLVTTLQLTIAFSAMMLGNLIGRRRYGGP